MTGFRQGTVHEAGDDVQAALRSDPGVLQLWDSLTPLGRNEFLCWVEDAKRAATRQRRIARLQEDLLSRKKRPCCWAGCFHRTDKVPGPWQRAVMIERRGKARPEATAGPSPHEAITEET
ncbi:YdeI/OmpD-associated family protein [Methylobacterium sp. Leaf118]|uniref:YdeI/OmpD-associated family protein n=1 Tax=Methylobacterium sp. Leaf118 TaxID=2876562 RepID=UPI001E632AC6|nr:YdeI/OmpD-associated family protein [Methylobacterium sp. Leaf118]